MEESTPGRKHRPAAVCTQESILRLLKWEQQAEAVLCCKVSSEWNKAEEE